MTQDDKQPFWQLLKGVHEFYRTECTKFAAQVWWRACERYSLEQVAKAFDAHLMDPKSGQFLPKPADIVKALQGTYEDRALLAWSKVLDAMQRIGAYESVAFDDPVIHSVVLDLGGWVKLCRSTFDDLPFIQRRFCDAYRAHSVGGTSTHPARLTGETEIYNASRGYLRGTPSTVLVGNEAKARAVLESAAQPQNMVEQAINALAGRISSN